MKQKKEENTEERGVIFARMEEMVAIMRERIAAGQSVELSPRGTSMLPMLREGRDTVVLSAKSGRLKKYDLPLYRRAEGVYVLHRVVEVREDGYVCIGDNQFRRERGVTDEDIIAVVTAYRRGARLIPVSSLRYRIYVRFWHNTRPVRKFLRRVKRKLRRMLTRKK